MKKKETRLVLKSSIKSFINRVLLTAVLLLFALIMIKKDDNMKKYFKENIFEKNFKFIKAKEIYNKYFGNILSIEKYTKTDQVFNEKLEYEKANTYKDGVKLVVKENYMVPLIESGIVVFMGEKEGYGKTVIIEQINGIDVWYSNVESKNIKMYDYVEKGSLLGEVVDKNLYLVFQKEGKFLDYSKYI